MEDDRFLEGEIVDGKYVVERILGEGGMGRVVAAHHADLGRRVALKFLLREHASNPEFVARFLREGRAASQLQSEHAAKVFDVARRADGTPYLVMELLEGEDVAARLQRTGPLPIATAIDIVLEACEALAEAHALGIVHRDMKPANLFLSKRRDGRTIVKILDFGIAKIAEGAGAALTRTTAAIGSAVYMSPEQLRSSRTVDARTDLWSLGVILFELLTAQLPFEGDDIPTLSVKIVLEPPRTLRTLRPDAPAELEAVIARCLEKDSSRRFGNVAELAAALAPFASERGKASVATIAAIAAHDHAASPATRAVVGAIAGGGIHGTMTTAPTMLGESLANTQAPEIPTRRALPFVALACAIAVVGVVVTMLAWPGKEASLAPASAKPQLPVAIERPETSPTHSASAIPSVSVAVPSAPVGGASPTTTSHPSLPLAPKTKASATPTATPTAKPSGGFKTDDY